MSSPTGTLSDEALVNSRAVNSRAAFDAAATFDPANDESFWLCGQGIADPHAVLVRGLPDCLLRHLPTCLPDCLPLIASQIAPLIASVIRPVLDSCCVPPGRAGTQYGTARARCV